MKKGSDTQTDWIWDMSEKKGADSMWKKGWILFLLLLCVAFMVSCGKERGKGPEKGELVRIESVGGIRQPLSVKTT